MIELAIKYESKLQELFLRHAFDEKFKYYWPYSYRAKYEAPTSTWERMEWAVLETGQVVGFIGYSIDRDSLITNNFMAINFGGTSIAFAKAIIRIIDDLFMIFKFRKLRFSVGVGNPIESSYDRLVEKFGGRICGLWRKEDKLIDGTIVDKKWYEIMREDYIFSRKLSP